MAVHLLFEISGFFFGVFRVFLGVFLVFLGVFLVFLGVFRVFLGCSWFSWECSGFFGGVPGFSGVPECSVMFRCSGVPVFRVPVFLEVLHAEDFVVWFHEGFVRSTCEVDISRYIYTHI